MRRVSYWAGSALIWAVFTIERRTPITRSRLKRPTVDQVRAWERKPRKPLPKIGPKAKRERRDLDAFREALRERSGGECEGPASVPHDQRGRHFGCDPHHLFPSDRACGVHDPERGLWVCRTLHDWIDANPHLAEDLGLLRPYGDPPHRV